jgi:hypothetical protein
MSKVEVVIASTTDVDLPSGDTFSGYQFQILQGTQVIQTGTANETSFTFPTDVAPGAYTATAIAVNQTGATMGAAATADFTVAAPPPATFAQPASLTVTVS